MFQFQQALADAFAATRAAVIARARLPHREQFRRGWGPETQEERAQYHAACRVVNREMGAAYAARLAAAVAAVGEGHALAFSEGQEGGIFHLPFQAAVVYGCLTLDNGVSARGLYRQVKGYYPSWKELESFVEEVCSSKEPVTPQREGRALRSNPILRDLADG